MEVKPAFGAKSSSGKVDISHLDDVLLDTRCRSSYRSSSHHHIIRSPKSSSSFAQLLLELQELGNIALFTLTQLQLLTGKEATLSIREHAHYGFIVSSCLRTFAFTHHSLCVSFTLLEEKIESILETIRYDCIGVSQIVDAKNPSSDHKRIFVFMHCTQILGNVEFV